MRTRHALAVLGLATVAILAATNDAHGQAPACGGHDATHTVPVGGDAECVNARVLLDGRRWESGIRVFSDGRFEFGARRPGPPPTADIPIEVAVHFGDSGSGGYPPFTGVLRAGQTDVVITGQFDITALVPFDCHTQIDAKAYNSRDDTPQNRVRLMGPHFTFENCAPAPVTTTTPPTAPSSGPATSTATTGVTVPTSGAPSTAGRTVTPGPSTLPATGTDGGTALASLGAALLGSGLMLLVLVLVTRKRATDAS